MGYGNRDGLTGKAGHGQGGPTTLDQGWGYREEPLTHSVIIPFYRVWPTLSNIAQTASFSSQLNAKAHQILALASKSLWIYCFSL